MKGLRMKELNKYLTNSFANFRSSVQKIEQLSYYAVPKLVDGTPNRILIHGGYNDISSKTLTQEKIANELLEMAKICRGYGVNDVFISSSIICSRNKFLGREYYSSRFTKKTTIYIYNRNIEVGDF